jgi:O-methyltransferase
MCTWAANQASHLPGDFVECGVWYGILSKAMCEYVNFSELDKRFLLFDSWGTMIGSHKDVAYQEDIFEYVKKGFLKWPNVELIRGVVPEVFETITLPEQISYLGIDMNGGDAELAALKVLYPRMVKGGIIYFDDYGWKYPYLREVVDGYFYDKPEKLIHFPGGNSLIIKV